MADKTATVRINVDASGFSQGIKGAEKAVTASAKTMGMSLSESMDRGIKGGIEGIKGLAGSVKNVVSQFAPLLGGIGLGALAKSAIDSESQFRRLSFTMGAGAGKLADWHALQKQASDSAIKWSQNSAELGKAMEQVAVTTGDAQFAQDTLDGIAMAAQGSGQSVEALAGIVSTMNTKFGITAAEAPEALASVMSIASRAGISVEDLGSQLGKMSGLAGQAGLKGSDGLRQMLGLVTQLKGPAGGLEETTEKLKMVFTKLTGDKAGIEKALNLKLTGKDAITNLEQVLKATKGDAGKLSSVFGEQGATMAAAFGSDVENFRANLESASTSAMTAADVQEAANDNNKSAQSGLSRSIEIMKTAFENPQMQGAIAKLAENLPLLADAVAKVIGVFADSPALGAGALIGGAAVKGALQTSLQSLSTAAGGASTATQSFASSLGGAVAANLAMAAAIGGLTVAADQFGKFLKEYGDTEKDIEGQREDAMANAERLGKSVAVREKSSWERTTAEDLLQGTGRERLHRDPKTGKVVATLERKNVDYSATEVASQNADLSGVHTSDLMMGEGTPEGRVARSMLEDSSNASFDLTAMRNRLFEKGKTSAYSMGDDEVRTMAKQMGVTGASPAGKQQDMAAAGRAMADQMAGRTLKVEVTNASDLRSPGGGGGLPGWWPR